MPEPYFQSVASKESQKREKLANTDRRQLIIANFDSSSTAQMRDI